MSGSTTRPQHDTASGPPESGALVPRPTPADRPPPTGRVESQAGAQVGGHRRAAAENARPERVDVDEAELVRRLGLLTLEQKVELLTGADFWAMSAEPAIGLRRLVMSDGPVGVRGESWDERHPSANVPSPTSLAATWDDDLVAGIGALLAAEARGKGVDVVLAPTVNLHRTPYGGRHFECFSEDPLLTGRIGAAYVRGLQGGGVGATVKHFVGNDSETERTTLDARIDERTLRELYLAPFEMIVREAGAWAVMAAYNGVNGVTMTESPLLRDVLRDEWGFDGVTMSDWFATRSTEAAARAGLDLAMPGPFGPWSAALVLAVRAGRVDEATIDDKVLRLLRLAARAGALDGLPPPPPPVALSGDAIAGRLRAAASGGFVLARNEPPHAGPPHAGPESPVLPVLPLDRARLRRVAVVGPNAAVGRTLGGGSATVHPPYTISPLAGIRAALGADVQVDHALGVRAHTRVPVAGAPWLGHPDDAGEGIRVRFLDEGGAVLAVDRRTGGQFTWLGTFGPVLPADLLEQVDRVEVTTVLRAELAGEYQIGCSGIGRYVLTVDGAEVFDVDLDLAPGADMVEILVTPPQRIHTLRLEAGAAVEISLVHEVLSIAGFVTTLFQLNVEPPHGTDDEEIARAVELARAADAVIVVVGTTAEVESEGTDRRTLALPGSQDELVRRVAAVNPATVVVVNAGAPVLLPWARQVPAVLLGWFSGQEFGHALADVLFGAVEPGGRLPTTWPATEDGLPSPRPVDGVLTYTEGLWVGHRAGDPAAGPGGSTASGPGTGYAAAGFPFGHGLGYTTWEFVEAEYIEAEYVAGEVGGAAQRADATGSAAITGSAAAGGASRGGGPTLIVRIRNTGARRGRQVVQVYASRPDSALARPVRWLAGYAAATVEPGATASVAVRLRPRAFEHWDVAAGRWAVEPGAFTLAAGPSSADLPLSVDAPAH